MGFLISQAKPAEAVLALLTSHVHAARVFLDQCLAFRACFGVHLQPLLGSVFFLFIWLHKFDLFTPSVKQITIQRSMRLFVAAKAVSLSTLTTD